MDIRFGYGLISCQRYPGDGRTDVDRYREALDLAAEAEDLGFDSVWTSEHHFADDAYMPSVIAMSAAIAARTSRIGIATGLALAPLYQPLRLAEDAATIDLLSDGRFLLGLGLGWLDWELEALGVSLGDRAKLTEETIRVCREAWSEGLVKPYGLSVQPKPARPGGCPIWLGAHAEPAVRRAARLADGWLAGAPTLDEFGSRLAWLRDELPRVGRPAEAVGVGGYWPVFVWDGPEDPWQLVRPFHHYQEWKYEDQERSKGRLGPLPLPPPLEPETERTIRAPMLCGRPDEVAEAVRDLAAVAGPGFTFVAMLYYPGMDRTVMRRSTRLFA